MSHEEILELARKARTWARQLGATYVSLADDLDQAIIKDDDRALVTALLKCGALQVSSFGADLQERPD